MAPKGRPKGRPVACGLAAGGSRRRATPPRRRVRGGPAGRAPAFLPLRRGRGRIPCCTGPTRRRGAGKRLARGPPGKGGRVREIAGEVRSQKPEETTAHTDS